MNLAFPTLDSAYLSPKTSRLASRLPHTSERSSQKTRQRGSRRRYRFDYFNVDSYSTANTIVNDVFEQGNRHIRAIHSACCCLDSKPTSPAEIGVLCATHEVAGLANSSQKPNALFVDVGYDTVLEAKVDLVQGTEVLAKYALV